MAKFSRIIRESNENLLITKFIEIFKGKLNKKKQSSKRLSFVLTGGKTPIRLYKKLANLKNLDWKKVDFFIGDERYVSKNSKNSNINLCRKYLLNKINVSLKQVFQINTNNNSIEKDTKEYEDKIKRYFPNKKINFDIVLLGIGNDGHIASLFKNNVRNKTQKIVDYVLKKDFSRITLTIKCINKSKLIFLWAPGKKKSKIIKQILKDKESKFPASYLRKKNNLLFYSN